MIVRRLNGKLKYGYMRGCKHKINRNLIQAIIATIRLKIQGIDVLPYKCMYGHHYHIGHKTTKTNFRNLRHHAKLTLFYQEK